MSDDDVYKPPKPGLFEISSFRTNRHFYYVMACFVLAYCVLAGKLVLYGTGFFKSKEKVKIQLLKPTKARPLILDRNGEVLATDIKKYSVYVEADKLIEKDKAARLLAQALPQHTNQMKLLVE